MSGRDFLSVGDAVPDTPLITRTLEHARAVSEPFLFNHVVRSWFFATRLARLHGVAHDAEVLAITCLLHDVGLTESVRGPLRFEVEGANAARAFAKGQGLDDRRSQLVWDGVALNSTPSIALHKEPEVALCTTGVLLDIFGTQREAISPAEMEKILVAFPRLQLKQRISACFCRLLETKPETSYDNFLRDYGERYVPGYKVPSAVDFVMNAPFDE